jgi:hypothetical protein
MMIRHFIQQERERGGLKKVRDKEVQRGKWQVMK